jgi:outer membrane lipoprotein SlyB
MEQGKTKFIRVRGKIVPLRQKKSGDVDKRHVSNKGLAKAASNLKATKKSKKRSVIGAFAGGAAGGYAGLKKGSLVTGLVGMTVGSFLGRAIGSTRVITKQEAANKLKKRNTGF